MFYKLINGQTFVGIATSNELRYYQVKNSTLLACGEQRAQYVDCKGRLYHDVWMAPVDTDKFDYDNVQIIEIGQEEYDALYEASQSDEPIDILPPDEPDDTEPYVDPDYETTVEYIRTAKLTELGKACNSLIFNGIDITLSDGVVHHFSLTEYDQLNLFKLETIARSGGVEVLPYHEDDMPCKFYPADNIIKIADKATSFITYHTTYFNSLKQYVKSLTSIEEIASISYGIEIPEEFQSDVWKELNKEEGFSE